MQKILSDIAFKLKGDGYILRSGAADGADDAFWQGVCRYYYHHHYGDALKRPEGIYLPWDGFNQYNVDHYWGCFRTPFCRSKEVGFKARKMAEEIHPAWERCGKGAKAMHARNVLQLLGDDLQTPSKFLICWAPMTGEDTISGGTSTAWELGKKHNVPRFNINNPDDLERIQEWLLND
jgi:hypothetical protein